MRMILNKLVRDKVPEEIAQSGGVCDCEVLEEVEFRKKLDEKLVEEVNGYFRSDSVESLAQIEEVVKAILESREISPLEFQRVRYELLEQQGGYQRRILLREVEN